MNYLKQSTGVSVVIGPFANYTSGVTPVQGITNTSGISLGLYKSNSAVSASLGGNNWLEIPTNGYYQLGLTSTDTGVTGQLKVFAQDNDSFVPVWETFQVITGDAYDAYHGHDIDSTHSFYEIIKLMFSVLTGKSSGGGTATLVFRDVADTKNRISCTVDADGNRTAVGTRDGT
jgi:hypothetical protein